MTEYQEKLRKQYNDSMNRANWFLTEYADVEKLDILKDKELIAGLIITDIKCYLESLGYDWKIVLGHICFNENAIKQGSPKALNY